MNIIFMGYAVKEREAETLSGVSAAGNKMQLNVLKGIAPFTDRLDILTVYPVSSYRTDGKLFYKRKEERLSGHVRMIRIPFVNLPFLKQLMQIMGNYKEADRIIKRQPDTVLFTFNMYPQVGIPAVWIKKKYGCRIVTLLADLPIDDNYGRAGIGKYLWEWFHRLTEKALRQIDRAVVLNRQAQKRYAPQAEYIVVEGGINEKDYPTQWNGKPKARRNIVYGGSFNEYSGVKELVQAMQYVEDSSIELDLYGDGHLLQYIVQHQNERIHYRGKIGNREMLQVQREAWLLVSPRPVDDKIAQVTFPSKIFEYLMSGTPVISTRLNGFTEEYEDLLIFAENNHPRELARCINETAKQNREELEKMAARARVYLLNHKTWTMQCEKIMDFIGGL